MQKFDGTPALVESQYSLLNININGLVLRSQDILDIQINYEDIIRGRVAFVDTMNLSELAPLTYALINIDIIDINKNKVTISAVVTDVKVLRLKNNQLNIVLKFEDIVANTLRSTYLSKSFKSKTLLQILESLFEYVGVGAKFYHDLSDHVYDYFITPANISLLDFVQSQIKISNVVMFSDRDGIYLVSRVLLNYSQLPAPEEYDFTLNRNNQYPHWNILEYDGNVSRTKETMKVVDSNLYVTNVKDLSYKPTKIKVQDVYETQKVNGYMGFKDVKFFDIFGGIGTKEISHVFYNDIIGSEEDYRDIINNQQKIEIVVQGLNVLRMYTKIKISLPRAVGIQSQESDETFSAVYVVVGVVDKLIGGNFLQFLTLNVSDYGKGSDEL